MSTPTLPPPESKFWKSKALESRSQHWPKHFGDRVPMRIRMLQTVRPDAPWILPPEQRGMILHEGIEYLATCNSHGAVCGITEFGELGVKPDEFEVTEWYTNDNTNQIDLRRVSTEKIQANIAAHESFQCAHGMMATVDSLKMLREIVRLRERIKELGGETYDKTP